MSQTIKANNLQAISAKFDVEIWAIGRLVPYEKNARRISDAAVAKVAASLLEFGWQQPIVVDGAGVIVVGHARRLAALSLGLTEVPVHIASYLKPEQIRAYRLADNRTGEETKWDLGLLAVELGELKGLGGDLATTAFSEIELNKLLGGDAEDSANDGPAPAPPAKPVSRLGDLWQLGPHRLMCGDATDRATVERLIGTEKPGLMVTDPPYGVALDGNWRYEAGVNNQPPDKRRVNFTNRTISNDTRVDWSAAFALVPSLAVAYVWHASVYSREVLTGLLSIGFEHHQQIIWDKGSATLGRSHYWFEHEPCWYVRRKKAPWHGKPGDNSTIWRAQSPKIVTHTRNVEDAFDHPTQKPLLLSKKPLLNHTKKGDLVYDPFLGSGTTLAAAELTGRRAFGLELDPRFVDVIILRWQKMTGKKAKLDKFTYEAMRTSRAKETRADKT